MYRGLLDPSASAYLCWPEFAAIDQEPVKVWHALTHSAGLSSWQRPTTIEDISEVTKANERLASRPLWWESGTTAGYMEQAITLSHRDISSAELVLRVTGKRVREFIADELSQPLYADFSLSVPEKDRCRMAQVLSPPPMDFSPAGFDIDGIPGRAPELRRGVGDH